MQRVNSIIINYQNTGSIFNTSPVSLWTAIRHFDKTCSTNFIISICRSIPVNGIRQQVNGIRLSSMRNWDSIYSVMTTVHMHLHPLISKIYLYHDILKLQDSQEIRQSSATHQQGCYKNASSMSKPAYSPDQLSFSEITWDGKLCSLGVWTRDMRTGTTEWDYPKALCGI